MAINSRGGIFYKTFFVLIGIFMTVSVAFSADSPEARAKRPATQPAAKPAPSEWEKVVEAAKKEGRIVISGTPGEEWRKSLVDLFQQEYPEITVEYTSMAGRNFWERVGKEREFGKKLWDLRASGGVDPLGLDAMKRGFLAPVRPLLTPAIADGSKWIGGLDGVFEDREKKYIFGYCLYLEPSAYVNRDFIKESDLKSSAQLLDPKFKGKIVIQTPTGGATQSSMSHLAFMYGTNFIRDILSKHDIMVTDDDRQLVEWVVRGKYPISIGFVRTLLVPFQKQGLGKNVMGLEDKIPKLTIGFGILFALEGAPHPNATKLYINWLLSQKTQTLLSQNIDHNSSRTDVPPVEAAVDQSRLSKYRNADTEESKEYAGSLLPLIEEALKR